MGLFACAAALGEFRTARSGLDWATATLNLLTGLSGVIGAIGYALRQRWGVVVFGLSVLGHFAAHTLLLVTALQSNRALTAGSLFGLMFIPVVALVILAGMAWERKF